MGLISSKLETLFVLGVEKKILKKNRKLLLKNNLQIFYETMLRVPKHLLVCFSMHCKTETAFGC